MSFFRDKSGTLYEGDPGVRDSLYGDLRRSDPHKTMEVENCSTGDTEDKALHELTLHSIWRVFGWVAVIGVAIIGLIIIF